MGSEEMGECLECWAGVNVNYSDFVSSLSARSARRGGTTHHGDDVWLSWRHLGAGWALRRQAEEAAEVNQVPR